MNALSELGHQYIEIGDASSALPFLKRSNKLSPSKYLETTIRNIYIQRGLLLLIMLEESGDVLRISCGEDYQKYSIDLNLSDFLRSIASYIPPSIPEVTFIS